MGDESVNSSPTLRASTRNVQRINYAELNSSGVELVVHLFLRGKFATS